MQDQIDTLHSRIIDLEWSGIMHYKITKGSVEDLNNMVIEATNILPLDIGSAAYTEFKFGPQVMALQNKAKTFGQPYAKIHSHHSMSAYFSQTDISDLEDNFEDFNMYLSLIVNYSGKYVAKIAFKGGSGETITYEGKEIKLTESSPKMLVCDCEIKKQRMTNNEAWFEDQVDAIVDEYNAKPKYATGSYGGYPGIGFQGYGGYKGSESENEKRYQRDMIGNLFDDQNLNSSTMNGGPMEADSIMDSGYNYGVSKVSIREFLGRLLSLDIDSPKNLQQAIAKLREEFGKIPVDRKDVELGNYIDHILQNYDLFLYYFFHADEDEDEVHELAIKELEKEAKAFKMLDAVANAIQEMVDERTVEVETTT